MIHSSSVIAESAKIGKNVQIGPFCYIGENVEIGDNCVLTSHVVVKGDTKIGRNNVFFQFCSIGEDCQDKKYAGETTYLEIGDDNVFRESCTIHRGTTQDQSITKIGNRNLLMVNTHLAHDCMVGDDNIFANNCTVAGHVHVGNQVILGGMTAVHQFCHIGSHAFTGGGAIVLKDVPPYVMVSGIKHIPQGINSEGLRRRGFTSDSIMAIKRAYKVIYRNGNTTDQALPLLNEMAETHAEVKILADFVASSKRGIVR
ncbi:MULTISPECIES: acyl-ACP--UDP-N-acetylglucosamine O-acyltransferase [Alteromonadaceae]|jgi:UDP-N-acetylglucosamine acyltransferase|uniref:Acyl-[acyl-carrier-protein]--UDP-N-acetylglucosamine O-acyltransferase n=1 Tax=Brumicola blandensis TaxID=3075611 RepID=A0AAW8R1G4_9ALTE|nr:MULTISPECIES: acyl-ACP--UDP-N-acetylglucosamine O-acyltransferase [unclassified Alteromonas]MDT0582740.1 acyl-ACP--UDP-N-acetylglucosamine O-acyltransferase [Alteromonas sp. W409]MDT0628156.1 acyl-ACP--UDP-N-acetylglucosamine O-acyltransferase [Alteromonas sp. W364]